MLKIRKIQLFKNQLIKAFDEYIYATECDESKVSSLIDQENNLSKISDLVAAYMQLSDEKANYIRNYRCS